MLPDAGALHKAGAYRYPLGLFLSVIKHTCMKEEMAWVGGGGGSGGGNMSSNAFISCSLSSPSLPCKKKKKPFAQTPQIITGSKNSKCSAAPNGVT